MKNIDKIIIVILGMVICNKISWDTPLPLIGLIPVTYVILYECIIAIKEKL